MSQGRWVTLHLQHFGGGNDRTILGYLVHDGTTQGYKLTKLAVQKETYRDVQGHVTAGTETTVHEGLWIVAAQFVWMLEYEDEAPVDGFTPTGG